MPEGFARGLALGPHDSFHLDTLLRPIREAFGMCYLVGSVLKRRDPRDIDIRCMVEDDDELAVPTLRRRILNAHISASLSAASGLPIDFQFQGTTEGNAELGPDGFRSKPRSAIGLGYAWREQ